MKVYVVRIMYLMADVSPLNNETSVISVRLTKKRAIKDWKKTLEGFIENEHLFYKLVTKNENDYQAWFCSDNKINGIILEIVEQQLLGKTKY